MALEKVILKRLIEKYESSQSFVHQQASSRRVILKPGDAVFKALDFEKYEDKEVFISSIKSLKSKGLIGFSWVKFEEENLVKEIWLNSERIEQCYEALEIDLKSNIDDAVMNMLGSCQFSHYEWLDIFTKAVQDKYRVKRSYSPELPKDATLAKEIIALLQALDTLKGETIYERVLSAKLYNDSKYFSKVLKTRFLTLVKTHAVIDPELEDEAVLEHLGILKHAELFEFMGPIIIETASQSLDFTPFKLGAAINTATVRAIESIKISEGIDLERVIFIENKSNYEHYISTPKGVNEIVVYHGGFYSPLKGLLFKHLVKAKGLGNAQFLHWSDIDYGGFLLYERLKRNLIPCLKPFQMDVITLETHQKYWKVFDNVYQSRLETLLLDKRYGGFEEVIHYMIDHNCRLEQESIL